MFLIESRPVILRLSCITIGNSKSRRGTGVKMRPAPRMDNSGDCCPNVDGVNPLPKILWHWKSFQLQTFVST